MASFFYVFVVCGAAAGAGVGASVSSLLLATSLASGLIVIVLTQCFLHVSGMFGGYCFKPFYRCRAFPAEATIVVRRETFQPGTEDVDLKSIK